MRVDVLNDPSLLPSFRNAASALVQQAMLVAERIVKVRNAPNPGSLQSLVTTYASLPLCISLTLCLLCNVIVIIVIVIAEQSVQWFSAKSGGAGAATNEATHGHAERSVGPHACACRTLRPPHSQHGHATQSPRVGDSLFVAGF